MKGLLVLEVMKERETDHTPKDYTPKNVVEDTFYYIILLIEHFSSRFLALN